MEDDVKVGKAHLFLVTGFLATVAACGGAPGTAPTNSKPESQTDISAPVTAAQVKALGDVTLHVWADSGEKATLADYVPSFEKQYPNVKVDVTEKGFDDLIKTVVNAMSSSTPPDVAQGNQGYAVDGLLVKAGLVRPLDDVAKAYGWQGAFSEGALAPFRWSDDGKTFGSGSLYGISPVTQNVELFYNKALLAKAGVAVPTTFTEFEADLPVLKANGDQPIMLGNSDKYPAVNLFGAVAGALTPTKTTNDWVFGRSGATIVVDGNQKAADAMKSWSDKGYLGTGFNGLSADDAAAKFGKGTGAFYVAGDWNLPTVAAGKGDIGIVPFPAGESGYPAATGSLGLGWHISSKTEILPASVAFVAGLNAADYAQKLADQGRVPVASTDVSSSTSLFGDDVAAANALVKSNGQTGFLDWASDTMYDESGARMQEMLAGKISPDAMLDALQKNWTAFQKTRQ